MRSCYCHLDVSTVKNTDDRRQKVDKSLSNFEIKQPNCTILFTFVFELSFIDSMLSKIVGFDQLWTAIQKNWWHPTENLFSSKCPTLFVGLLSNTVVIFLPCPKDTSWILLTLLSKISAPFTQWSAYLCHLSLTSCEHTCCDPFATTWKLDSSPKDSGAKPLCGLTPMSYMDTMFHWLDFRVRSKFKETSTVS